jgi:hypothetical protein
MKHIIVRYSLIVALIGVVAASTARAQAPTEQTRPVIFIHDMAPVGLAHGQSLRITVSGPSLPDQGHGTGYKALVCIFIVDGKQVARSEEITIPAGGFHSFNFDRNALPLPGEAGTGRLQLRGSLRLSSSEAIGRVAVSMEIVEVKDGTSHTVLVWEKLPSQARLPGGDIILSGLGNDAMMGIVPGQTLRITLLNPPSSGSEAGRQPTANGHVMIFSNAGILLAQSGNLVIPSGEFRSFDFNRNALSLPGEPGTGRLQVRAVVEGTFTLTFTGQTTRVPLSASWELVDNSTGRTIILLPAIQAAREASRNQ